MAAADFPRSTTERQQLLVVLDAAETLVNATSDSRVPPDARALALAALHGAWGALQECDARKPHVGSKS